jgi:hypothetical protein
MILTAAVLLGPAAMGAVRAPAQAAPAVSLIYAGWFGNTIPTPAFIRDHQSFLETQPFQGIVAYLRDDATGQNATTGIMGRGTMAVNTLAQIVSPLQGLAFRTLVDNFGLVQGTTPPDFFDDWSTVIQNFANLATVLRNAGLRGICFDNEQYAAPWGCYPAGAKYPNKSLSDYQTQARLRGSQVMQAMTAQFPSIAVITLHGPYISELQAPASLKFPQWQSGNNLLGPFFAGFVDGAGNTGVSVDGGELYTLRSDADFMNSYTWRKYTLPSDAINCPFIPPALRTVWPDRVSISFGVYDRPFGGADMNPSILQTTLTNALHHADRYVWFYTEGSTFLLPQSSGGAGSDWVGSVRQAVAAVGVVSPPSAPSNLVAQAASSSLVTLQWTDSSSSSTTGQEIQRKTGSGGDYITIAQIGAGVTQYQDGLLSADTTYVYRVRSNAGTAVSAFSNESTVTTDAAPVSPPPPTPPSGGDSGGGDSPGSGGSTGSTGSPAPAGSGSSGGGGGSCGLLGIEGILLVPLIAGLRRRRKEDIA